MATTDFQDITEVAKFLNDLYLNGIALTVAILPKGQYPDVWFVYFEDSTNQWRVLDADPATRLVADPLFVPLYQGLKESKSLIEMVASYPIEPWSGYTVLHTKLEGDDDGSGF